MAANHLSNGNGVSVQSYPEWELSASRLGPAVTELMEFYKDLMVALGFLPRRKGPVTIPVVRARIEKVF